MKKEQKDTLVGEIIKTDFALQNAMEEAGMEARTYGIWGLFWRLFGKRGAREKRLVKKKTYMLLAVFTGFMGGHRFYAGRKGLGMLYLLFFWTLIPVMMTMLDLMEVIPIKSDENGYVMM